MKIKSIKKGDIKPTWDLNIKGEEHYITKNGCVSHNTSQILGNNEAFEPFTSNIYKRNTLSGEFVLVNKYLVIDLIKLGLWTDEIRNKIIMAEGSVQNIDEIPQNIKDIYKTVWEIKLRDQIDMSADRGAFICQSQSFNLHVGDINKAKITTALMYGWRKGLKTLSYYIRGKSITNARKDLGVDTSVKINLNIQEQIDNIACSLDNPDDCVACSA
jgi:ribonucleoside-diphosphate reductase alpha chain